MSPPTPPPDVSPLQAWILAVRPKTLPAAVAPALAALLVVACGGGGPLMDPGPQGLTDQAPDSFRVAMVTSEGTVHLTLHRDWAPLGVDRAWHLFRNDFWAGARFYRVEEGFVAQWGFSGVPALDSLWQEHPLEDESVSERNRRGVVSFARGGPRSRSITLFVNYADNPRLDTLEVQGIRGYPPLGAVDGSGMEVLDGLYRAYADNPPSQDSISTHGNDYLRRHYPQLDSIVETRVTATWR